MLLVRRLEDGQGLSKDSLIAVLALPVLWEWLDALDRWCHQASARQGNWKALKGLVASWMCFGDLHDFALLTAVMGYFGLKIESFGRHLCSECPVKVIAFVSYSVL